MSAEKSCCTPTDRKTTPDGLVAKRKISGGIISEAGKIARDVKLGLAKIYAKLDVSFWCFLGDGFDVPGAQPVQKLQSLARLAAVQSLRICSAYA